MLRAGKKARGIEYSAWLYDNHIRPHFPTGEILLADGAMLPFKEDSFDMVVSFDVLEHLPEDRALLAVKEIHRVTRQYFYGTISDRIDYFKKFHLTVKPPDWWAQRFIDAGFVRCPHRSNDRLLHVYEKINQLRVP